MKKRNLVLLSFLLLVVVTIGLFTLDKSFSYGVYTKVTGTKGSRVLEYYDSATDTKISVSDAKKYYGVTSYDFQDDRSERVYFKDGKEISKDQYDVGYAGEQADLKALRYGNSAYRVRTTQEFKNALDNIYRNYKIGELRIIFSPYDDINLNEIKTYYDSKYGLTNPNINYYRYANKGPFEPDRFGLIIDGVKEEGELELKTYNMRISSNEMVILQDYVNRIMPYLYQNGNDFQKISAAYQVLRQASYLTDNGFWNDTLGSNTSAYDALISRQTTCIGYSIGFSYLMDRLGIESYIVDDVVMVDESSRSFSSVHTWNIVKLNNKFYKVDITGNQFLTVCNPSEIHAGSFNLATSAYNQSHVSIDLNSINKALQQSKTIKTTTTKVIDSTTTTKYYPNYINGLTTKNTTKGQGATNKTTKNTYKVTTSQEPYIPVTNEAGEEITTEEVTTEVVDPSNVEWDTTTTKQVEKVKDKKQFNLNIVLIPLVIILVAFLILYKVLYLKKKNKIETEIK